MTFVYARMRTNTGVLNLRLCISHSRLYSTVSSHANPSPLRLHPEERKLTPDKEKEKDAEFRKRKTEWKRRQGVRLTQTRIEQHVNQLTGRIFP